MHDIEMGYTNQISTNINIANSQILSIAFYYFIWSEGLVIAFGHLNWFFTSNSLNSSKNVNIFRPLDWKCRDIWYPLSSQKYEMNNPSKINWRKISYQLIMFLIVSMKDCREMTWTGWNSSNFFKEKKHRQMKTIRIEIITQFIIQKFWTFFSKRYLPIKFISKNVIKC